MKRILLLPLLSLLIISCSRVNSEDLTNLNGYWEIEKVVQPDGKEVDFGINTMYDYYQIDDNLKGFHKKATPQLDGTFLVDDFQENITITHNDNNYYIDYNSEFNERKLVIQQISQEHLTLKNDEDKIYYYKRANPIDLTSDEKQ